MTKLTVEIDIKNPSSEQEYPFLGISTLGAIVLFSKSCEGTIIAPKNLGLIGDVRNDWIMSYFKPISGSIKLTQT